MKDEDKKLLEAANLIKENCENLKLGNRCPFAKISGKCDRDINCVFTNQDLTIPKNWNIPRVSRWSKNDIALAKSLIEFGVQKVKESYGKVLFVYEGLCVKTPEGAFSALNPNETVCLKDIVVEGENDG